MTAILKISDSSARPSDPTWLDISTVEAAYQVAPSTAVSIEIVEDRASFEALEPEWNSLHEKAGRRHHLAFQSHAWLSEWCAAFALDTPNASTRLAIAVVRQGDTVCLICPFAVDRCYGVNRLIWMANPPPSTAMASSTPSAPRPSRSPSPSTASSRMSPPT